ncbi:MAG: hypothetical protein ACYS80_26305 [Planctomycetota bacterium]|jgi:hypothetical protein
MTSVRPSQGGSDGTWGTELNAWLDVEHDSQGRHTYIVCNEDRVVCNLDVVVTNSDNY